MLLFFFYVKEAQCHTQGRQDFYYGAAPGFHVIIGLLLQFLRAAFISMLAMQISVGLLRRVCDTKRKAGRQYQKFKVGRHPFFFNMARAHSPYLSACSHCLLFFSDSIHGTTIITFCFLFPVCGGTEVPRLSYKGKGGKEGALWLVM